MRDQHRDKRDLINELTDLRKQVSDLKQAAAERRRLEDGLRREEEMLRTLVDTAPVALCLMTGAGEPLVASQSFARRLGYASPGELVRLCRELGVPAAGNGVLQPAPAEPGPLALRCKDGSYRELPGLRAGGGSTPLAVALLQDGEPLS